MNDIALVRPATLADCAELAAFAAHCFTETFGHNYPADHLTEFLADSYPTDGFASSVQARDKLLLVAVRDGAITGYVEAGPLGLPVADPELGAQELKRLYLGDSERGTGLAAHLFTTVSDWARSLGAPALYLGVWTLNPRALAFYARMGMVEVGAYQFKVGGTLDDELILRLAL
jgi:diamine N-acetyltransferase